MAESEAMMYWRYITSSINRLLACLDGLSVDELNWKPLPSANSLYTLGFHTFEITSENILTVFCQQPGNRQRDLEFSALATDTTSLFIHWNALKDQTAATLQSTPDSRLDELCDHPRRGQITGREILLVVARHSAEHLGQAELTLDLLKSRKNLSTDRNGQA